MQSHIEKEEESKDIENPAAPLLSMSDDQYYDQLNFYRTSLLSYENTEVYATHSYKMCNATSVMCAPMLFTVGTILLIASSPDEVMFKVGCGLYGGTLVSCGFTALQCWSGKFRVCMIGMLSKPIIIPTNFDLDSLNQILNSQNIKEIKREDLTSTKNLNQILNKIEVCIAKTHISKPIALGKAVISALPSEAGFFAQRDRLILSYLINNEKALDIVVPHNTAPKLKK